MLVAEKKGISYFLPDILQMLSNFFALFSSDFFQRLFYLFCPANNQQPHQIVKEVYDLFLQPYTYSLSAY